MSGFLRGAVAAVAAAGGGGGGGGDLSSLDASVAVVMGANASSVAAVAAAAAAAAVTASPPEAAAAATVGGGGGSPPGDPVTAEDIFGSLVSTAGTHIGGGGGQEPDLDLDSSSVPVLDDSFFLEHNATLFPPFGGGGGLSPSLDPVHTYFHARKACGHFAEVQDKLHLTMDAVEDCVFWTQGVGSLAAAAFGLLGNAVSIWVLSVPEMRTNAFNRLLLALAIVDCLFIVPGAFVYTAKAFDWWKSDAYNYAFPLFLYPFSEMALCSSIFMTVAIAVERYIGLCRPMQRLSGRGPYSAKFYIFPVLILSFLLNVPKFLESETVVVEPTVGPTPHGGAAFQEGFTKIKITELRMDPYYITYYTMWTRLLATGVVPLLVLALLNSKIYLSIRQSKQQLRILAIRSALPMAILGQSAPSVPPLADLMGSTTSASSSSQQQQQQQNSGGTAAATSESLVSESNKVSAGAGGGRDKDCEAAAAAVVSNGKESVLVATTGQNGSPKAFQQQEGRNGYRNNAAAVAAQSFSPAHGGGGGGGSNGKDVVPPGAPLSGTSPAASPSRRYLANGQLRQIQRSVSAFEPALKRTLRIKDAHILRSNSTTVAGAAASGMNPSSSRGNVIALASQWQQGGGGGGPMVGGAAAAATADIKLAPILFGVVIVFILCNSLRVLLNIYDFTVLDDIIECHKKGVGRYPPTWVMCSISVSHLLLMVNSSVNFLVYCVAGTRFRRILFRKLRVLAKSVQANLGCCGKRRRDGDGRGAMQQSQKTTLLTSTRNNNNRGGGAGGGGVATVAIAGGGGGVFGNNNAAAVAAAAAHHKLLAQVPQAETLHEEDEEGEEGDEEVAVLTTESYSESAVERPQQQQEHQKRNGAVVGSVSNCGGVQSTPPSRRNYSQTEVLGKELGTGRDDFRTRTWDEKRQRWRNNNAKFETSL